MVKPKGWRGEQIRHAEAARKGNANRGYRGKPKDDIITEADSGCCPNCQSGWDEDTTPSLRVVRTYKGKNVYKCKSCTLEFDSDIDAEEEEPW